MNPIKDIIYNPPVQIKLQKWELDRLSEMGISLFELSRGVSATGLAKLAFEAGEWSGRNKFKKELRNMLGVDNH